jgi:hypothetical protein
VIAMTVVLLHLAKDDNAMVQVVAMKTKHTFERIFQKPNCNLPASLSREIGRVIVRWAHFENRMQAMIWAIVFDGAANGAALGRLAIRELKADERADLLGHVADVQGVVLDKALLKAIKRKARALGDQRNLLAHGIWTSTPDFGWVVRQTRGIWEDHPEGPKGKRSTTPQSIPMTAEDVRQTVVELDALIADAKKLDETLRKTDANR